jgi:hypothetical protein
MKVRLIKESSGFGYSSKIVEWMVSSEENMGKLEKIKKGKTVEIPERIAKRIHNLVDVETGNIISVRCQTHLNEVELKKRYADINKFEQAKTREAVIDTVVKPKLEIDVIDDAETTDTISEDTIKPIIKED